MNSFLGIQEHVFQQSERVNQKKKKKKQVSRKRVCPAQEHKWKSTLKSAQQAHEATVQMETEEGSAGERKVH